MSLILNGTDGITFPNSTTQVSAGQVLQVVQSASNGTTSTTSTSYVQTNLTASITPTSSSNKILILANFSVWGVYAGGDYIVNTIYRNNTTNIIPYTEGFPSQEWGYTSGFVWSTATVSFLDSPATTSSTTYTMYVKTNSAGTSYAVYGGVGNYITLMEIAG